MSEHFSSWGRVSAPSEIILSPEFQSRLISGGIQKNILASGNGRSYGDVCLNQTGLCDMRGLDRLIAFDEDNATIECQSGVLLHDLLKFIVPRGYFVPVTPGTAYVTLGGMVANDVHGKNHHVKGSFGCHVISFYLLRSEQGVVYCSQDENQDLFYATIGGLGLTGIILSIKLKLQEISTPCIQTKSIRTRGITELLELFGRTDSKYEYTVSWLDLSSSKLNGVFSSGEHCKTGSGCKKMEKPKSVPFDAPDWLLNNISNSWFNRAYFLAQSTKPEIITGLHKFFYPLDGLADWNRLYGKRGFYQYQFVVPDDNFIHVFSEMFELMRLKRQPSYLSVLKKFGDIKSPGLLSFPRSGYTLAMDFPNKGPETLNMFDSFDRLVVEADGALYPAKDARMSRETFEKSFPRYDEFSRYRDKMLTSDFWRRVSDYQ